MVRFCHGGTFPPSGSALHPKKNLNKCLDVKAAAYANGTPVQMFYVNNPIPPDVSAFVQIQL